MGLKTLTKDKKNALSKSPSIKETFKEVLSVGEDLGEAQYPLSYPRKRNRGNA
jgi:hypothetical protein